MGLGKKTPTRITYYIHRMKLTCFQCCFQLNKVPPPWLLLLLLSFSLVRFLDIFSIQLRVDFLVSRAEGWFEYFDFALPETTRYKRSKAPHSCFFLGKKQGEVGRFRCKGEKY